MLAAAAVAGEEEEELTVFAVNRDTDQPLLLEARLGQFAGYRVVEHIVLEHEDLKARNTKEEPEKVVPHNRGDARVEEGFLRALLPRLSWNVIRMTKL